MERERRAQVARGGVGLACTARGIGGEHQVVEALQRGLLALELLVGRTHVAARELHAPALGPAVLGGGQTRTVVSHRLVCPGTVDERVEEVVAGKRHIADLVLPKSSSLSDLSPDQLRVALGLRPETLLTEDAT